MSMRRRKLVLIAAATTLGLVVVAVLAVVVWLRTPAGLGFVRSYLEGQLASRVDGRVHLGLLRGSLLSGDVTVDSLELRDAQDSVLVASGPIAVSFALSDLIDGLLVLRNVTIERPVVHLYEKADGEWNFRRRERPRGPPRPPSAGRRLGDVIVVESLWLRDATLRVSQLWAPDRGLRGAARDSAIRKALQRPDSSVRRVGSGFIETYNWTQMQLAAPYARIKHPDSAGVFVRLARLDVHESRPPFVLSEVAGTVRVAHDTVHLDVDRFRLPGSVGRARGTVAPRDGLGIAVSIVADTVSLADVAWIMPTFPTEGGGRMVLDIRRRRGSDVTNYALSRMDVRTTQSRLTGAMTFGIGGPVLAVTNINLQLDPVDFELIEQFSGKPLALPWAGQLRGRVQGPGGPVNTFVVDESTIDFTDTNVPGVVNKFRGAGELDITFPAFTAFHDFALDVEHLDFRTLREVNPKFPPLLGSVRGFVRLDSLWTDVRFRDANVTLVTASQPDSRFTGNGRVTLGEDELIYDVSLVADSLSLDALAVSYPSLALRGSYSGPFTVRGSLGDLAVTGDLRGAGGQVVADLRLDVLEPMFGADGNLRLAHVDPAQVMPSASAWGGDLSGRVEIALRGDSLQTLDGALRVQLERSRLGDVRLHAGRANASFGGGLMRLDTLVLETSAGRVHAGGGLGLSAARNDSIVMAITVDSLGGLRPLFPQRADPAVVDSLAGSLSAAAILRGNFDTLNVALTSRGRDLVYGATRVGRYSLRAEIEDLFGARTGDATLDTDSALVAGVRFASLRADVQTEGTNTVRVGLQLRGAGGAGGAGPASVVNSIASVTWDSLQIATRLESLGIAVASHRWRLSRPATIVVTESAIAIDSLVLTDDNRGRVAISGTVPDSAPINLQARVEALSLADLGALLQMPLAVAGDVSGVATMRGVRDAPELQFEAIARDARVGEARVEGIRLAGTYRDRSLRPTLEYRGRDGEVVMTATAALPLDLSLRSVAHRRLDLPLEGSLRADSTSLAVVETFSSLFTNATGRLDANLTLGGTWQAPRVAGQFAIVDGGLGLPRLGAVRLENLEARVRFFGDSLRIDTLSAQSGDAPGNRMRIFGGLRFAELSNLYFEEIRMIADRFLVIDKPGVADLEISGALRLVGPMSGSTLSGTDTIVINRNIYIPDAVKKDVIALDDPEFFDLTDTTMFSNRRLLPSTPRGIVENMTIQNVVVAAGPNLWLRSNEANIQLGGALQLRTALSQRRGQEGRRHLALEGTLFAAPGGTYRLNLGFLQKVFIVESGTIQFFEEPDVNPTIDISAIHTVRQYDQRNAQQDVRIRVTLGGTLSQMTASLSSPDSLRISHDDLISYLMTGEPSFSIGGRTSDYTQTAARVAIESLGSVLASSLAGGFVDVVDVRTAGVEGGYGGDARTVGGSILSGTRIGAGKQLGDQTFLRADFGLCQVGQVASGDQSFDPVAFANAVGVKIDYRFRTGLGASFGREPPTGALLCASGASARGFVQTPGQWSFDLFKLWRF